MSTPVDRPSGPRRWSNYETVPWRNGGGTTREVARDGDDDDFTWRVSIADVASDGPFSTFAGIDRVITLVDGPGMSLTIDGVEHMLAPLTPLAFSGDSDSAGRLTGGPVRDLNLMTRRGLAVGLVVVRPAPATVDVGAGECVVIVALAELSIAGHSLGRLDAWVQKEPGLLAVEGAGPFAELRFGR